MHTTQVHTREAEVLGARGDYCPLFDDGGGSTLRKRKTGLFWRRLMCVGKPHVSSSLHIMTESMNFEGVIPAFVLHVTSCCRAVEITHPPRKTWTWPVAQFLESVSDHWQQCCHWARIQAGKVNTDSDLINWGSCVCIFACVCVSVHVCMCAGWVYEQLKWQAGN